MNTIIKNSPMNADCRPWYSCWLCAQFKIATAKQSPTARSLPCTRSELFNATEGGGGGGNVAGGGGDEMDSMLPGPLLRMRQATIEWKSPEKING